MTEYREVRHHPTDGDIAIHLGPSPFDGSGSTWLLVHRDERGDVRATGLKDADVADWPKLTPDTP